MSYYTWVDIVNTINFDKLLHNQNPVKEIFSITFHGGEPTLLNKKTFYDFCDYSRQNIRLNHTYSIQTNLLNIDADWCKIFNLFGISVGLSWDGVSDSNINRNNNSFEFYKEKIDLLTKYNVDYGILVIVNKQSINHIAKTLDLLKELGVKLTKINYVEDVYTDFGLESDIEISGQEFFEKVIKYQLDNYIDNLTDSNLIELINRFINNYFFELNMNTGICGYSFCGAGKNVIEVEPNGSISFCGRYSDAYPEIQLNRGYDFGGLNQMNKLIHFAKIKHDVILKQGCDTCYAKDICSCGCMAFYYSKSRNNNRYDFGIRTDLVCDIYKSTFKYFMFNLDRIFDVYMKYCFSYGQRDINIFTRNMNIKNFKIFEQYLISNNVLYKKISENTYSIHRGV
jgi:uncharacterized protein